MIRRSLAALVLAIPLLTACEQISELTEITLDGEDGIPPIEGSTAIDIPQDFQCGDPIEDPNDKYTVKSSGTADKCTFTFQQDVVALKAADYSNRPELEGARFVKSIDIEVKKLGVKDAATGKELAPIDLNGKAFDTTILTKEDLTKAPPYTKTITGAPIDALKANIEQKRDVVIPVNVAVVVSLAPMPPAKIGLEFDAQPAINIGF
ncbi:hypothetical protein [Polyangium aurulentum]|uniref:hypothetical protein n=1 Tax=Polyangium aurulentum TaxID=2567896 RepID=UPI00146B0F82|nr:hypothetical protein [Polyangium aurulentum]UQA62696.1 hypothetical protein E8A73_020465 [Polyangium aurulentum]